MAKAKGKADNGTASTPGPLAIRRVRLDDLHADPANVNTHGEANLRQIRDSLREFGQVEPLVVHKATGKVIGGNGRLEIMRAEGWTDVDIVEFDGSPSRAMALAIALNRPAKTSTFNNEALAATLRALQEEGFPVTAAGFSDDELDALLGGLARQPAPAGEPVDDPQAEWGGMPEFAHEDLTAFRSIHVHFKSEEDVQSFAELVGQPITERTKFLWHPRQEIIRYGDAE